MSAPTSRPGSSLAGANGSRSPWGRVVLVLISVCGTLLSIELILRLLFNFPGRRKEASDALSEYKHADPTVLVLGSSHARTFDSVAARLATLTDSNVRVLAVPLEYGKHTGFWWVLQHRLAPLIDEVDSAGAKVRPSLEQVVVITTWWDSCHYDPLTLNIPARAWGPGDFLGDVGREGITNYNRAYLSAHWSRALSFSALVRNRAGAWIPGAVRERFLSEEQRAGHEERQTEEWKEMVEKGVDCIANPAQMAAMDSILDFFEARRLPVTVLLYPLKPGTLTDKARATTLPEFTGVMQRLAVERGFRLIDAVTDSPLTDADFSADYDHLRARGDGHFAAWAVSGPFSYLTERRVGVTTRTSGAP
jgi:hypothetical protein